METQADVETRRYAVRSLAGIASQVILHDQLLGPFNKVATGIEAEHYQYQSRQSVIS